jgi:hypothetical protein
VTARQLIRAERRNILVPDRGNLEEVAGDSDGLPEAEYERLVGSLSQAQLHIEPELLMGHTTAAVRRAPLHNFPIENTIVSHCSKSKEKCRINTSGCAL